MAAGVFILARSLHILQVKYRFVAKAGNPGTQRVKSFLRCIRRKKAPLPGTLESTTFLAVFVVYCQICYTFFQELKSLAR